MDSFPVKLQHSSRQGRVFQIKRKGTEEINKMHYDSDDEFT